MECGHENVTHTCCDLTAVISDVASDLNRSLFCSTVLTFLLSVMWQHLMWVCTKVYLHFVSFPVPVHYLWSSYLKDVMSYQRVV
jgi:hypothetical protein